MGHILAKNPLGPKKRRLSDDLRKQFFDEKNAKLCPFKFIREYLNLEDQNERPIPSLLSEQDDRFLYEMDMLDSVSFGEHIFYAKVFLGQHFLRQKIFYANFVCQFFTPIFYANFLRQFFLRQKCILYRQ